MKNKRKQADKLVARRKAVARHATPWESERWFAVEAYFDPTAIRVVPMRETSDRMFLLGKVSDTLVLHVPAGANEGNVRATLREMEDAGLRVLAFSDNVQFVKLRMCSDAEEAALNAREDKIVADLAAASAASPVVAPDDTEVPA